MKTNTSIKQPAPLKPLHPRLTPEDRFESDLRLLHRALCLWERKNQLGSVPVNHPYARGGDPARPQSPHLGFRRAGQRHFWM